MDGEWSMSRSGRFISGKDSVPITQEAGWAPGPVRTARKISPPSGFDPPTVQSIASRATDYKQNKVASINEGYYKSHDKFSFSKS
jgi:hypothetical protein